MLKTNHVFAALLAVLVTLAEGMPACATLGFINDRSLRIYNCTTRQSTDIYSVQSPYVPAGPAANDATGRVYLVDPTLGPAIVGLDLPGKPGYNASALSVVVKDTRLRGRRGVTSVVFNAARSSLVVYVRESSGVGGTFYEVPLVGPARGNLTVLAQHPRIDTDIMQMDINPRGQVFFTDGRSLSQIVNGRVYEVAGASLPCPFRGDGTCYIRGLAASNTAVFFFTEDQSAQTATIRASSLTQQPTRVVYRLIKTDSQTAGSWTVRMSLDPLHNVLYTETYRSNGDSRRILQLPVDVNNAIACIDGGVGAPDCSITASSSSTFAELTTVSFATNHHAGNIYSKSAPLPPVPSASPSPGPGDGGNTATGAPALSISPLAVAALMFRVCMYMFQ